MIKVTLLEQRGAKSSRRLCGEAHSILQVDTRVSGHRMTDAAPSERPDAVCLVALGTIRVGLCEAHRLELEAGLRSARKGAVRRKYDP